MKVLNEEEIRKLPPHPLGVCPEMRLVVEDFRDWWAGKEHRRGESYCINFVGSENVLGKALCKGDLIHRDGTTFYKCRWNGSEFPITLVTKGGKEE